MAQLEQYFANELQYLTDAGREFASKNPQQAALLNPDNVQARDPHVERLFESFAFLTATIRAKLDDELPEIAQSLLGLLSPQYVRPVPAMATVQLIPDPSQLTKRHRIVAGASVEARPFEVRPATDPVTCIFRTCYDVDLYPIELRGVKRCGPTEGREGIELTFALGIGAKWEDLKLDTLRLHLHADSHQMVYSLYEHLMCRVHRVELVGSGSGHPAAGRILPVGFAREEEVIPYDVHSFSGFRLVQEYFCFPEKFLYADVQSFGGMAPVSEKGTFTVRIWFTGETPGWWTLSPDNFRLFCTPVINLCVEHALPLDYDQRKTEYPLDIDQTLPEAYRIHSVTSVMGRPRGVMTGEPQAYRPFFDFRHNDTQDTPYYHLVTRDDGEGESTTLLSLVMPEDSREVLPEQVLSVDVLCFHGDLPRRLRPGDISVRGEDMSHVVSAARNLGAPTPVRFPPDLDNAAWHFVSHVGLNQLSLSDVESLGGVLRLYDWTAEPANRRRIEGLTGLKVADERAMLIRRGMVMQGLEVQATLDESCFTDPGDAWLFAEVLRRFLSLYASMNSFVRVRVHCERSNEEWSWPPLDGRQMTI